MHFLLSYRYSAGELQKRSLAGYARVITPVVEKKTIRRWYRPYLRSAGGSETSVRLFLFKLVYPFAAHYVVVDPALENRYQSTIDTQLRGGSPFPGS